ncbi:MAG TPA: polyprenol monophosphomannose synthase [Bacteroidia bacterium]|nr:polyprenol monophosphomannose synthase [Bacteroidia bacterium]
MPQNNTLIFIPTYNEVENVERIFNEITSLKLSADILFLDDNSPDGTGDIIDRLSKNNSNVFTIHRTGKLGIGSAHQEGIKWAYDKNYELLVTMDCDFTHSPSYIFDFIKLSDKANIVVGSRYMQKDSLATWNLFRKFLTYLGHFLTVTMLNMPYDASGAFRLYDLKKINKDLFKLITSPGYSFFFESLFILYYNKITITETPIELPSRTYGTSKMTWKDAWNSLRFLLKLSSRKIFYKKTLHLS